MKGLLSIAAAMLAVCAIGCDVATSASGRHAVGSADGSGRHQTLSGPVATQYDYDLSWSPAKRLLRGRGSVEIGNLGPLAVDRAWLYLRANGGGRPSRIAHVRGASLGPTRAGGAMQRLDLPEPLAAGSATTVNFDYALRLGYEATSLGRSGGVDLFGDALPVIAATGPRGVRIGMEPSYGEGTLNPVADWTVRVRVPRGLDVVLPGAVSRRQEGGSTYFFGAAAVRDTAFAIGRLHSLSAVVGGVRVRVFAAVRMRTQLRPALRRAERAFGALQRLYGGYRLPALNVVVVPLAFGGSEYPGVVFSAPDLATVAHEVAHQWFYGIVGNDQFSDPWLDESIASFEEQKFSDYYECDIDDPLDGARFGLRHSMAYWDKHPQRYEHTIYRGGACALLRLEHDIGRRALTRAIRTYVHDHAGGIATTQDFVDAVNRAAPGYDIEAWLVLCGLR